jgi:hypothetical protein
MAAMATSDGGSPGPMSDTDSLKDLALEEAEAGEEAAGEAAASLNTRFVTTPDPVDLPDGGAPYQSSTVDVEDNACQQPEAEAEAARGKPGAPSSSTSSSPVSPAAGEMKLSQLLRVLREQQRPGDEETIQLIEARAAAIVTAAAADGGGSSPMENRTPSELAETEEFLRAEIEAAAAVTRPLAANFGAEDSAGAGAEAAPEQQGSVGAEAEAAGIEQSAAAQSAAASSASASASAHSQPGDQEKKEEEEAGLALAARQAELQFNLLMAHAQDEGLCDSFEPSSSGSDDDDDDGGGGDEPELPWQPPANGETAVADTLQAGAEDEMMLFGGAGAAPSAAALSHHHSAAAAAAAAASSERGASSGAVRSYSYSMDSMDRPSPSKSKRRMPSRPKLPSSNSAPPH